MKAQGEAMALSHLEEVVKAYHIKCVAQKVKKVAKAKTREKAKKRKIAEEEKVEVPLITLE